MAVTEFVVVAMPVPAVSPPPEPIVYGNSPDEVLEPDVVLKPSANR
jgi:hypothetical protein